MKKSIKVKRIQYPIKAIRYAYPAASTELLQWLGKKFISEKESNRDILFDRAEIKFYTGEEFTDFESITVTALEGDWIFGDEVLDVLPANEFRLYFEDVL